MSNESELVEIQSELIRSALYKTIENEVNSKNYKIKVKSASTSGATNFVGIVYRVYYEKGDKTPKEKNSGSSLILKVSPLNAARRAQFCSRPCFLREIYLYDEILPYYRAFEESKGVIVGENGFIEYPKCYRTIDVEPHECLLLEDLSVREFKAIDRKEDGITVDHVHLYLRALAKYHAISLALKDQQPEKFQEFASNCTEVFIRRDNSMYAEYFKFQSQLVMNKVIGDKHPDLLTKLKKLFVKDAMDVVVDLMEAESKESAVVISYGDANPNNIMFIYDSNGKPIEISLFDWQTARLASPIIDFLYFIFICTTKKLRDAQYDGFLKIYHGNLSTHLRRLGSDPEKIFSYEMMLEHLRKFGKFGLLIATTVLPTMCRDSESGVDLDELAEGIENGQEMDTGAMMTETSKATFLNRIRDVVIDMARLEYI